MSGRRRRSTLPALVASGFTLLVAPEASASTQLGSTDPDPQGSCLAGTIWVQEHPNPTYTVPSPGGVITSWGHNAKGPGSLQLKVWNVVPDEAAQYQLVGQSAVELIPPGPNSFPTRIPVPAGAILGLHIPAGSDVSCSFGPSSTHLRANGNADPGDVVQFPDQLTGELNVLATLEPDSDGDLYGDETQDGCPSDASTQGPCPSPGDPPGSPPESPPGLLYLSIGDSFASGAGDASGLGYTGRYFDHLRGLGLVGTHVNRGGGGPTPLTSNQLLDDTLNTINQNSDTRVVTVDLGIVDWAGPCRAMAAPPCVVEGRLNVVLAEIDRALAGDPGEETRIVMAYFSHPGKPPSSMLGTDLSIACVAPRSEWGLNDLISSVAARNRWLVADTLPGMAAGGARFISADGIHPNALGYAAMAEAFKAPGRPATVPCDRRRPRYLSMGFDRASFPAAPSGASVRPARVYGTRVTYRLTEPATSTLTVERASPGRRVGRRCVRPTRANRRRPRCTRYVAVRGIFRHDGRAGLNRFRFTGRVAGRKLRPGRYRLVAIAKDRAGNRSAKKRRPFRIIR